MIQFMTFGPHGSSKWVEYKVKGPISQQLQMADKVTMTHHNDDGVVITTFRKV